MKLDTDKILAAFNSASVGYILIGGMNFASRHLPYTTFDVDLWVEDGDQNLEATNAALQALQAEWGPTDELWKPITGSWKWLKKQACFCTTTNAGALDIFREVSGLEGQFQSCFNRALLERTKLGTPYRGLSDVDMLTCQEVLPIGLRDEKRIQKLREALGIA